AKLRAGAAKCGAAAMWGASKCGAGAAMCGAAKCGAGAAICGAGAAKCGAAIAGCGAGAPPGRPGWAMTGPLTPVAIKSVEIAIKDRWRDMAELRTTTSRERASGVPCSHNRDCDLGRCLK